MGTWESSRSRIEIKVEDHTKRVTVKREDMPFGANEQAYLSRRLREENSANPGKYDVSVSYKGQTLSKRE